jgi:hypothetical protein
VNLCPPDARRIGMNEEAIRRAALVTLRRAIQEGFTPGAERTRWLLWAARAAKSSTPSHPILFLTGRAGGVKQAYRDASGGPHDANNDRILES